MVNVTDKRKTLASTDAEPVTSGSDGSEQTTGTASADEGERLTSLPAVNVVEKRDPATELIEKVFAFVVEQPEFYHVLQLSRAERRLLANHIAKTMTTFPHFKKTGMLPNEPTD